MVENEKFSNGKTRLFSKRVILNIGMLLQDSNVAIELRSRLLDIVQDASEGKDNIVENIYNEMSEEKRLIFEKSEAEFNGDWSKVSLINAKLFDLKNKRIKDLEIQVEDLEEDLDILKTNSLTIIETRAVINKLVRKIAVINFNCMYGKAWGELYSKINYKLSINLKARKRKSNQSILDVMTDEELRQMEIIVKCWADEIGIDVKSELELAS